MYASAIGTTVLQLKEIPPRPAEYDGALCLFNLNEGVNEAAIRVALEPFGEIVAGSIKIGGWPSVKLCFTTHEAALNAKQALEKLKAICGGVDTLYNERRSCQHHVSTCVTVTSVTGT